MLKHWLTAILSFFLSCAEGFGQARVDRNIVYGMHAGTALLMDIYHPGTPNGYGIILVAGNGWLAGAGYAEPQLKSSPAVEHYGQPLLRAGYTLFAVNHRGAPTFPYPAAVKDIQRAVRFIRYNASTFGVRGERIGGWGSSSGGHLVALMGVLEAQTEAASKDPVDRESSRIQCIAAVAPTTDFLHPSYKSQNMRVFMGLKPGENPGGLLRMASPVTHVTPDDAPFMMVHGDKDSTVAYDLSVSMLQALTRAGVPAKLLTIPGGEHDAMFRSAVNPPDYRTEIVRWFDQHLKLKSR